MLPETLQQAKKIEASIEKLNTYRQDILNRCSLDGETKTGRLVLDKEGETPLVLKGTFMPMSFSDLIDSVISTIDAQISLLNDSLLAL